MKAGIIMPVGFRRNKLAVVERIGRGREISYLKLVINGNGSLRLVFVVLFCHLLVQIAFSVAVHLGLVFVDAPLLDDVALFDFENQKC